LGFFGLCAHSLFLGLSREVSDCLGKKIMMNVEDEVYWLCKSRLLFGLIPCKFNMSRDGFGSCDEYRHETCVILVLFSTDNGLNFVGMKKKKKLLIF
jgi:hypothetical protein